MANPRVFNLSNEDFDFSLESYGEHYFIHNEVRKFTPAIRKELLGIIDHLSKIVSLRVACAHDNLKLLKYCRMFGFEIACQAVSPADGELKLILKRKQYGRTI